jgi:hypothetical protein
MIACFASNTIPGIDQFHLAGTTTPFLVGGKSRNRVLPGEAVFFSRSIPHPPLHMEPNVV